MSENRGPLFAASHCGTKPSLRNRHETNLGNKQEFFYKKLNQQVHKVNNHYHIQLGSRREIHPQCAYDKSHKLEVAHKVTTLR